MSSDSHSDDIKISPGNKKLIKAAVEIAENDPAEIGFVCRSMVSASMPHSKVKDIQYRRENNKFILTIIGNPDAGGVPYGVYPRLLLSWIATEVAKNQSREILLGSSLSEFMRKLGLQVTGGRWGTITRFKEQLKRLFSAHISFTYEDKSLGRWVRANMNIADRAQIFWNPADPDQIDMFNSKVLLSEIFHEEIIKAPIPVDIRAINALKSSSLALDIYFWLTYRMSYLEATTELPFPKLQMQFGAGYEDTRQGRYEFKRQFLNQLKKVLAVYPAAKVAVMETSLMLSPSPAHIKKTLVSKNRYQLDYLNESE